MDIANSNDMVLISRDHCRQKGDAFETETALIRIQSKVEANNFQTVLCLVNSFGNQPICLQFSGHIQSNRPMQMIIAKRFMVFA